MDAPQTGNEPTSIPRRVALGGLAAGVAAAAFPGFTPANAEIERRFTPGTSGRPQRRPNLLFILADDMGWGDLSSYGAPQAKTPNLDRLAASGIRYTQGYSAASVCSPTRFGLYTGRYPGRLQGGLQEPIPAPSEIDGIPLDHPTIATQLSAAGYDTAMIGKWHCGFLPWFSPTRLGWDEFFGNFSGGIDYFSKISHTGAYDLYEDEVEYDDLSYYTHLLADRATDFIARRHRKPWLLNLNFTTPHWPWEGPGDQQVSDELTARINAGEPAVNVLQHRDGGSIDKYVEMVEDLDRAVGRVIRALERTGQRHNTLVVFASDNGGERYSYQWPFSGGKLTVLEGGLRVPTIASWPGAIRRHQVDDTPVITYDWSATFLDLAGAEQDPDHPFDGQTLVPHLFGGRRLPERDLFWRLRNGRALRRGDLKYVRQADGVDHLYDVVVDPHEQADLARRQPEDLAALKASWEATNADLLPYPA